MLFRSRIDGDTFPVQILESKKLSPDKNLFLKNLRSNLDKEEAQRTVDAYKELKEFESKNAYIYRLAGANPAVFRELMSVSDTAIKEVVVRALAEEGGWFKERDQARDIEKAKKMLRLGDSVEKVADVMELPLDMVRTLA